MLKVITRAVLLPMLCAVSALAASAQNVQNPKTVEFDPSADHDLLASDGQPVVTSYDMHIYLQGASAPISTTSLGKPAPDADGKIRVDFSTLLVGWPLANGTYEARVVAVGPTGSAASDVSNAFDFTGGTTTCTYSLSSSAQSAANSGGSANLNVVASASTCAWTAVSPAAWVTVSPTSGTGSGAVTVTVAANAGAERMATLTVADQPYAVSQAAVACGFSLSSSAGTLTAAGGSASVGVTANLSTCAWAASSSAAWVTVSPASGTGSGTVAMTVAANDGLARTATVSVGGQRYTITQDAVPCAFSLSASSASLGAGGGSASVGVMTNLQTCSWSASSSDNWVTVSPASGTGGATVAVSVAPNTGAARAATLSVAGQSYTVSQSAFVCTFSVSPTSLQLAGAGSTSTVALTANGSSCGWAASSGVSWITLATTAGTGSGPVSYSVTRNKTGSVRTGTFTVGNQAITVTQDSVAAPGRPKGVTTTIVTTGK